MIRADGFVEEHAWQLYGLIVIGAIALVLIVAVVLSRRQKVTGRTQGQTFSAAEFTSWFQNQEWHRQQRAPQQQPPAPPQQQVIRGP